MVVDFNILELIRVKPSVLSTLEGQYHIISASPATGVIYITHNSPYFLSGHVRLRGRNNGKYPFRCLEMIDTIFGPEKNTIEVCSHNSKFQDAITVDINPAYNPDIIDNAQTLSKFEDGKFNRWRCDPPYNAATAKSMYNTELPVTSKLLQAGARICKSKSLLFLLLGPQNYQWAPEGVRRIGWIAITIVPNNELRTLHIYYKE
jgi:hypothetical protein